jgi:flagellar hook-associated protein 2
LGISTTNDRGHIQLDEDKLKKALEAEPNSVYQIFGKLDSNDDYNKNGVAQRLSDVMYTGLKKIKAEAGASPEVSDGSTIGNKILEWQTKMSDFKKMMSTYENMLYKKYDNMETAIQKLTTSLGFVTYNNN